MGWFSFLDPILDFIFGPLLYLPAFWAITLIAFLISLIIVIIYKYATDQDLMKQIKDEIKTLQKQAKELKNDPSKAMEVNKKAMEANMKYMSHTFKPTLITIIPIFLIYGWLSANFAYDPLMPGQEFSMIVELENGINGTISIEALQLEVLGEKTKNITDGKVIFVMKGNKGEYNVQISVNENKYYQEIKIDDKKYKEPITYVNDKVVKTITLSNKTKKVLNLGFINLNFIWTYILLSILFSTLLRKYMKVY